jgi:hypothetical protein
LVRIWIIRTFPLAIEWAAKFNEWALPPLAKAKLDEFAEPGKWWLRLHRGNTSDAEKCSAQRGIFN